MLSIKTGQGWFNRHYHGLEKRPHTPILNSGLAAIIRALNDKHLAS